MIAQALIQSPNRTLISVSPIKNEKTINDDLYKRLYNHSINKDQIVTLDFKAKDFLENKLNIEFLSQYIPIDEESPFV